GNAQARFQNAFIDLFALELFDEFLPGNRLFPAMPCAPAQTFDAREIAAANQVVKNIVAFDDAPGRAIVFDECRRRLALSGRLADLQTRQVDSVGDVYVVFAPPARFFRAARRVHMRGPRTQTRTPAAFAAIASMPPAFTSAAAFR